VAANASSWQSKRWTALASLVVLVSLYGVMWYLMGGCESTPPDPIGAADPTLDTLEAMGDANVKELTLHIAWFHTPRGRLPASLDELRKAKPPAGWPPTPTATTDGRAIAYRATGRRTYELTLGGKSNAADNLTLPVEVPADVPPAMTPTALRTWWDLEYTRAMMQKLQKRLNTLAPPGT
jgi:hypothetical protein